MTWTNPETWDCVCGATGSGGKPAFDDHVETAHPASVRPPKPEGLPERPTLRDWAWANGWPCPQRGPAPRATKQAYEAACPVVAP